MTEMRVWAPRAGRVELVSGRRTLELAGDGSGWWRGEAGFIRDGVDYAFRLDGEGPFPDPRSPWQPRGVHEPSRWVDHSRFPWTDRGWQQPPLGSAVIYELHVGTFTPEGTFEAVIERLDHLAGLGITHLELMPVAEFDGLRGWGYDGVDLYAPHHGYGGPRGLKKLVDACHRRGLAVLLDVVYNHLGPTGNYLHRYGPYFTDSHTTPWGDAVNFDGPGSDQVRRFFADNALMWLRDYHLDGLRLDAVHAIIDTSAVHFLEQLAGEVGDLENELGRHLVLIAESDLNDPRIVRSPEAGGYGLDAQWNEDFHHALHAALTGEREGYYRDYGRLADLAKALEEGLVYDGRYSVYRRRSHGRPAAGLSGNRFVGCLQNHDQIGNRALGRRVGHLLSPEEVKLGAALVLTAPFVPMIFQGEEWASPSPFLYFTDHRDPGLAGRMKDERGREFSEFGWDPEEIPDPQAEETFARSRLDWEAAEKHPHREILEWHRELIRLRRNRPELTDGRLEETSVRCREQERWLVLGRGRLTVALNFSERERKVPLPGSGKKKILLASEEGIAPDGDTLRLPPRAAVILEG